MPPSESWLPFVFPAILRSNLAWTASFAKNRRSYLLGYSGAALELDRLTIESIHQGLSPLFREDPRRYIPLKGWRELLRPDGEHFSDSKTYQVPPPGPAHGPCQKWGQFGKDQPEHAWLNRPMRLFDVLKAIAALYDAHDGNPKRVVPRPSKNGIDHDAGDISIHVAIFTVRGFTPAYFNAHFSNNPLQLGERVPETPAFYDRYFANNDRCQRLANACGLFDVFHGQETRTFYEISRGLSCTYRTAERIVSFAEEEKLPPLGPIDIDLSARGTNRHTRQEVTRHRQDSLRRYSDCAVEIFTG